MDTKYIITYHNVILFWIVWMFFGGDFQHGWNGLGVVFEDMPNIIGNVLID